VSHLGGFHNVIDRGELKGGDGFGEVGWVLG
jgi:hypothetical protein